MYFADFIIGDYSWLTQLIFYIVQPHRARRMCTCIVKTSLRGKKWMNYRLSPSKSHYVPSYAAQLLKDWRSPFPNVIPPFNVTCLQSHVCFHLNQLAALITKDFDRKCRKGRKQGQFLAQDAAPLCQLGKKSLAFGKSHPSCQDKCSAATLKQSSGNGGAWTPFAITNKLFHESVTAAFCVIARR